MDQDFVADAAPALETIDDPAAESASGPYLGRWNRLVSTTNWEKGRIICQWRERSPPPARPRRARPTRPGAAAPATSRRNTAGGCAASGSASARSATAMPGCTGATFMRPWSGPTPRCGWKGPSRTIGRSPRWSTSRNSTLDALEGPGEAAAAMEIPAEVWDDDAPLGSPQPPEAIPSLPGEVHEAAGESPGDAAAEIGRAYRGGAACGRSRTCHRCRPTFRRPSRPSSWRSCVTGRRAGRRFPARRCWPCWMPCGNLPGSRRSCNLP